MRVLFFVVLTAVGALAAPAGNRFTVLDEFCDIYYPNRHYPKLTTPQWIGEEGVDAALVLAIDDMREPAKYETYLRPILERLKQIDGRAPVSIMTCNVNPGDPQLQSWLKEGVSLEAHTIDHPCPILDKGDFPAAKSTYDRCIDLLSQIEGNHPVAFRTPCMDGINSVSPRLFAEVMMRTNPGGRFLTMSTSIGMLLTPEDSENAKELVTDRDGKPRFNKYLLPGYVNYIKDYPYPWVIGNKFWEVGFCVPDDYEGFRVFGDKGQQTVDDMKASIDAVVAKNGVWAMTFHPYNWIDSKQVIEVIDHAIAKHGQRVKFLTLREVQERIDRNLLGGQPLRAADGDANGVRLLDLDSDGHLDVVVGNGLKKSTRLWNAAARTWREIGLPTELNTARVGAHRGRPSLLALDEKQRAMWAFDGQAWVAVSNGTRGLQLEGEGILAFRGGADQGVRLRDLDGDETCELIVSNPRQNVIFGWDEEKQSWSRLPFALPQGVSLVTEQGRDNGVRFVDFNKDGADDLIFSNDKEFGLWLYVPADFLGFKRGFTREIMRGRRGETPEIPMIVRGGEYPNNGAWFAADTMFVQNEDTGKMPDLVQRISFKDLLDGLHPAAKTPAESRAAIETIPGFQVELVAHEPQVESPVYLNWSADGTLWVVEMRDYPNGINGKPAGVIKRLQDEDGDGLYEKSSVFLDGLNYPNGLFPWRKGLLISAAPDILYAEDSDGDGRADKTEVLFTGFVEGNQQHRANGYEWGLDGWVYGANGDSGGEILSKKTGKKVSINRRDFRFKPDTGEFEAISGSAQFGRHRDDWGNWFGGANYSWGWHYSIEEHYIRRNPGLAIRSTYKSYATAPDAGRVFPISRVQQRFNDIGMAGHVTSGCSFSPYRDNLFGADFQRSIFICEPVHNLVHREVLEPDDVSFRSHRAAEEENREFLASRDPWFRPTSAKTGPDGALYICDMYRLVIEHPEWIPEDVQKRMNLRAGEGMGRIYRVRPREGTLRKIPDLTKLTPGELVARLNSSNGWERDTAQRLLIDAGPSVTQPLAELARTAAAPQTRLQALYTLHTRNELSENALIGALNDPDARIREHAIKLSEPFLRKAAETPNSAAHLALARSSDPSLRVRYQLALSAGECNDTRVSEVLARLALRDGENEDMMNAILSSSLPHYEKVLEAVIERDPVDLDRFIAELIKMAARQNDPAAIDQIAKRLLSGKTLPAWKLAGLAALLNAAPQLTRSPDWRRVADKARAIARDSSAPANERLTAIELLGRADPSQDRDLLLKLMISREPRSIRRAALRRLDSLPDAAPALLSVWREAQPEMRAEIGESLLRRPKSANLLLDEIAKGGVSRNDLGAALQQEFLAHRDASIRERAGKLLGSQSSERDSIVREYLTKLGELKGDSSRGRALFETHCAVCHKIGELGTGAGPNLATLRDRGPEQIVVAILDPNQAIEERYRAFDFELKDGEEMSGFILNENANSVTLITATGIQQTVLRRDVRQMRTGNRSLMPEGFETFLKPPDMADLISFIQNSK